MDALIVCAEAHFLCAAGQNSVGWVLVGSSLKRRGGGVAVLAVGACP